MERFAKLRQAIQQNLLGVRDDEIRGKARILIRIMESKSVQFGCDQNGITTDKFYQWIRRLNQPEFDLKNLKNKSTRPHNSPTKTTPEVLGKLLKLREKEGSSDRMLSAMYEREHGEHMPHSTICAAFKREKISGNYRKTKENKHNKRYVAAAPLDRVQGDSVNLKVDDLHGNALVAVAFIDDCTKVVHAEIWDSKGSVEATETLKAFIRRYGIPILVQTDNGTEFTNRYISELHPKREKPATLAAFEMHLGSLDIPHHLIKPRTPQHNGKIERFNRTFLNGFARKIQPGLTIAQVRQELVKYLEWYNTGKFHCQVQVQGEGT